jgi:molybdate/tungstate transport system ATP-binding protein
VIELRDVTVHAGGFRLSEVNLTIGDGEYFVILGPTGAGKTVLLETIAGLNHVRQGNIVRDGRDITRLSPEERHVGYVPQDYVLFPFLGVTENIAFGLKRAGTPAKGIADRVNELALLTGVPHLLGRDSRTLSGGEKQRVALARALATSPSVLLLDEPLGALDLRTARYLRHELRRVHRELNLTTVHITHDLMEAMEMADRVAIVQNGRIEQVAGPEEMLFNPEGERVMDFIGSPNILDCDASREAGPGIAEVTCRGLTLTVPHEGGPIDKVAILPRHVYLSETRPPGLSVNGFEGTIESIATVVNTVRIRVRVGDLSLQAELPFYLFDEMDLAEGQEVFVILRMRRIRSYRAGTRSR